MSDDIVTTLRRESFYRPTSRLNSFGRPQMGFELVSFNLIAADEIERLRAERDEARRRVCEDAIRHGGVYRRVGRDTVRCETPQEVAEIMKWDCYRGEARDER